MTETRIPYPKNYAGPSIVALEAVDIAGAQVREDHQAAAVKLQLPGGDRLLLNMGVPILDALLETLQAVRRELDAHGVERTISFKPVHSIAVSEQVVEGRRFVCMMVDRSLPSAQAFLMPADNARVTAKALNAKAREVSSAGEPRVS